MSDEGYTAPADCGRASLRTRICRATASETRSRSPGLVALYHEIWTEVTEEFRNKDPHGGLPLNPRDHLWIVMQLAARGSSREEVVEALLPFREVDLALAYTYVEQLEREAAVDLS